MLIKKNMMRTPMRYRVMINVDDTPAAIGRTLDGSVALASALACGILADPRKCGVATVWAGFASMADADAFASDVLSMFPFHADPHVRVVGGGVPPVSSLNQNGAILWRGASPHTGAPILAVATGLEAASANAKTGDMVQTWILPADVPHGVALATGADAAVCGSCPHRPAFACLSCGYTAHAEEGPACPLCGASERRRVRACYVRHGPRQVAACAQRGGYRDASRDLRDVASIGAGRVVRLGAFGDPAMVPFEVWAALVSRARAHTGYTHQSRAPWFDSRILSLCMVSADTPADVAHARSIGARAFYVRPRGVAAPRDMVTCPASAEAGRRVTCDACRLCGGSSVRGRSVTIAAHGTGAAHV